MMIEPRATLDRELMDISEKLIRLSSLVDIAIQDAMASLQARDRGLAEHVIERDEKVNELRFDIEEHCLRLIVTQQPAAGDLRAVVAVMSIVVDLERMGDHAAGMAKTVVRMGDAPLLKPLIDIPKMADLARKMLASCVEAFINRDSELAFSIAARDDEMDFLYMEVFNELLEIMARTPESVERATYLLFCAHNLERIGDRVTNIAERVVFMCTGDMQELNV